jgi:hypothetical protein
LGFLIVLFHHKTDLRAVGLMKWYNVLLAPVGMGIVFIVVFIFALIDWFNKKGG